jgi:2-polyprenyl-3-methyl-5-hydroxy-6-metoxy-1,4-benzoquinol methylase
MINFESHHIINQPWPEDDLEYLGSCPLCGSDQRSVLHEGLRDRVFFCAPGSWTLHCCEGCGCAYLDPRPTPESIARAYEQYYTHEIEAQKWSVSLLKLTKKAVRNGYLNRKWGTSLSPSLNIPGMLVPKYFKSIIDGGVMRHLPRPANGGRLLDVGCGNGQFLSLAQNAGWRITGFDLDPRAVEIAHSRCVDVRLGGFETVQQENDFFDAITVSHVIEHVYNPKELLSNCYRLLRPGGYFWITTPNVDSYGHSKFKRDWRGLEPPRHLQLLSWTVLQRLLEEAGFVQVTMTFWQPEYLGIYISSKAIKYNAERGKIKPKCMDRIMSYFVELNNRNNHTRREFITLHATKGG